MKRYLPNFITLF